jgi:glycosyltransferase involved in cell wall biosynthesis
MLRGRPTIIHIHTPDLLFTAIAPLLFGKRVIYDVHEFYHVRFNESDWMWPPLRAITAGAYVLLERVVLPHCAGIIVVTEEMCNQYARYESRIPVVLVRNYPFIPREARDQALLAGPPIPEPYIVHTGGASRLKAFDVLVAVAERLRASGPQARIVNLGPIDLSAFPRDERARLLERAEEAGVILPGSLPHPDLLRWVAHARIGYILYQDNQTYALGIPTKMFEYFAFGLPVVASRVGQTAELVRDSQAGLLVHATSVDEHVEAISRILSNDTVARQMSAAAFAYARRYDFEPELQRLLMLYAAITTGHRLE